MGEIEIFSSFCNDIDTLISGESDESVQEANNNLLSFRRENISMFVHFCSLIAENAEAGHDLRYGSLIFLRKALTPDGNCCMDFLQANLNTAENHEMLQHLFQVLGTLTFDFSQNLQKVASEAFAHSYAVVGQAWPSIENALFNIFKPENIVMTSMPYFSFFTDLLEFGYYSNCIDKNEAELLLLYNLIIDVMSSDYLNIDDDFGSRAGVVATAINVIMSIMRYAGYFLNAERINAYLSRCDGWLSYNSFDLFQLTFESMTRIAIDYYILFDDFRETLFDLLEKGMNCDDIYPLAVIDFWVEFTDYEVEKYSSLSMKYFRTNDEWEPLNIRRNLDTDNSFIENFQGKQISKTVFEDDDFFTLIVGFVFRFNEETINSLDVSEFLIPYRAATAIRNFSMLAPSKIPQIFDIIDLKSSSTSYLYGSMLLLQALCYRFQYRNVLNYILDNMADILNLFNHPDPIILWALPNLLKSMIKVYKNKIHSQELFEILVISIYQHAEERDQYLLKHDFQLISAVVHTCDNNIASIILEKMESLFLTLLTIDLPDTLKNQLDGCLVEFIRKQNSACSEPLQHIYLKYQENMINCYPKALQQSLNPSFINFIHSTLWSMAQIQTCFSEMNKLKDFVDLCFKFIDEENDANDDPQLLSGIFAVFCKLIESAKTELIPYSERFIRVSQKGLSNRFPPLVGLGAELYGSCIKYCFTEELGKNCGQCVECLDALLSLLSNPNAEMSNLYMPEIIKAFGNALEGFKDMMPDGRYSAFMELIELIMGYEVDRNSIDQLNMWHQMYSAIFEAMIPVIEYNCIIYQNYPEGFKRFTTWIQRSFCTTFVKNKILKLSMHINEDFLFSFCYFCTQALKLLGPRINLQVNSRHFQSILKYAYWFGSDALSKSAMNTLKIASVS